MDGLFGCRYELVSDVWKICAKHHLPEPDKRLFDNYTYCEFVMTSVSTDSECIFTECIFAECIFSECIFTAIMVVAVHGFSGECCAIPGECCAIPGECSEADSSHTPV